MSDSHVNDIRYTALWRPVVKAREAPAASSPSPSPPLSSSPARPDLGRSSLSVACGFVMCGCAFPFSFPLGNPALVSCSHDVNFADGIRMRTWIRPQILFALMESAERAYALSTRGGGGGTVRDNCVPLRTQQPCVSPSGTRCCLCGDNRLSLMTHRRPEHAYPSFVSRIGRLNLYLL